MYGTRVSAARPSEPERISGNLLLEGDRWTVRHEDETFDQAERRLREHPPGTDDVHLLPESVVRLRFSDRLRRG